MGIIVRSRTTWVLGSVAAGGGGGGGGGAGASGKTGSFSGLRGLMPLQMSDSGSVRLAPRADLVYSPAT